MQKFSFIFWKLLYNTNNKNESERNDSFDQETSQDEALKLIYQIEMKKETPQEVLSLYKQSNNIDDNKSSAYIDFVVNGTFEKKEELDEKIKKHLKGWTIERISRISHAAIRLALFEMAYCDDVPASVAINEAVELTKKYDSEQAAGFVNGILGAIVKEAV